MKTPKKHKIKMSMAATMQEGKRKMRSIQFTILTERSQEEMVQILVPYLKRLSIQLKDERITRGEL